MKSIQIARSVVAKRTVRRLVRKFDETTSLSFSGPNECNCFHGLTVKIIH
jgi:hypothetical protein